MRKLCRRNLHGVDSAASLRLWYDLLRALFFLLLFPCFQQILSKEAFLGMNQVAQVVRVRDHRDLVVFLHVLDLLEVLVVLRGPGLVLVLDIHW